MKEAGSSGGSQTILKLVLGGEGGKICIGKKGPSEVWGSMEYPQKEIFFNYRHELVSFEFI